MKACSSPSRVFVASFSQSSEQTTASSAVSLGKSESCGPTASAGLSLSRAMLVAVQGWGSRFWSSGSICRSQGEVSEVRPIQ
jgi:hypothetical protein